MTAQSSWLSRDQRAQADFVAQVAQLKSFASDFAADGFNAAIDALASATSRFGACELSIRRAERLSIIDLAPEEASALTKRGLSSNERGLAALGAFAAFVDGLESMPVDKEAAARWKAESSDIREQWREQLAQVDVGPADAQHLLDMTNDCFGAIDSDGVTGLARYLRGHIDELDKIRRMPERGTWANSFPWWKIVAAAVWLGITAFSVWQAVTYGAPWWSIAMIIFIALIGTILIALGC